MIPAGAFVAFGDSYEGMLPVRSLTTESGEREWWELNEEGTILNGERTGATLRLGDRIRVCVERVDARRGRVDLVREPAGTG
jgi:ribonuclease R